MKGNAANTNIGFRFRALGHCTFRKLRVLQTKGVGGIAYKLEWTVANVYESLVCTSGENNVGTTLPQFGIVIDAFGDNSQDNTFLNPIIEGLHQGNAVGLHIINGSRNYFIGGTIEHNDKHVEIEDICWGNMFLGAYFEDATAGSPPVHVTDRGQWTQWISCRADGASGAQFHVESGADHTVFLGGEIVNLVLKAGAHDVLVSGVTTTTVSDAGTRTVYLGLYDQDTGVFANTRSLLGSISIQIQPTTLPPAERGAREMCMLVVNSFYKGRPPLYESTTLAHLLLPRGDSS